MTNFIYRKEKQYSRPHDIYCGFTLLPDSSLSKNCTIIPIIRQDEGLGDPSGYNSNPEHASFAISTGAGVYPESYVGRIRGSLKFQLGNTMLQDQKSPVKVGFMVQALAFKEDYDASDEMTGEQVKDVLEVTYETTDRQGYPIYDGVDVSELYTGSADLESTQPGLTTDSSLEFVQFDPEKFYDALHYGMHGSKLKKVQTGLKWLHLTKNKPFLKIRINQKSKSKAANEYTMLNLLVITAKEGTKVGGTTEVGATDTIKVEFKARYDEWNSNFDHARV